MESSKDNKRNIIIMCAILFVILLIVVFLVIGGNKTYTVTFNDGYSTNEVEVKNNHTVEKPSNPEKEGYKFIGWYKDGIKFDFSTKIDKNVTLKAMFEKDSKKDDKKEITTTTVTTTTEEVTTTSKNKTEKNNNNNVTTKTNAPAQTTKYVAPKTTTTTRYVAPTTKTTTTTTKATTKTTTTTKKVIQYGYYWVDDKNSSIGQSVLYIINKDTNARVSGTATITYVSGASETISIPASGRTFVKSTVSSVSNVRGN